MPISRAMRVLITWLMATTCRLLTASSWTIRVEDLENGIEIQGLRLEESDPAALFAAASQISVRLRRALQIPLQETVERFNADFVANNMDAYEAYVAGLGFLVDFDYEAAEVSFEAALSLSPEYHMATAATGRRAGSNRAN